MKDVKVPEEKIFWLKGGIPVHNLTELIEALHVMEAPVFKYHVKGEKNDFAIWIEKRLEIPELAHQIKNIKEPESMATMLEKHLELKVKKTKKGLKKKTKIVKRHTSKNVSKLRLIHDLEESNRLVATTSYIALGVVTGVAATILILALA